MTAVVDLDMPRLSLEIAVDQLTRPERRVVEQGDGTKTRVEVPCLIAQLAAARHAGQGIDVGERAPDLKSKPPLWIDPASLLARIEHEVRPWRRANLVGQVRAWLAAMMSVSDADVLGDCVELAEAWVREARAMLEPTAASEITGPCPVCWSDVVWWRDSGGEWVRRHALRGTEDPLAVWCTAEGCSYRAEGEALWLLSDHLRRQTEVEHLGQARTDQ